MSQLQWSLVTIPQLEGGQGPLVDFGYVTSLALDLIRAVDG